MGESLRRRTRWAVRGFRPVDLVLAGVLTALGVALMVENVGFGAAQVARAVADGSMVHALSSHSWAMLPAWCLATLPVLWWRRGLVAVTGIALAAVVAHDLAFGWVGRCGAGLPLAFVLAYLGGVALERARAFVVLGLTAALVAAVLVLDVSAGFGAGVIAWPVVLLVFGIGRAVRSRTAMAEELRIRGAELRDLRDRRAALEVAGDRARVSRQLDTLLQERLARLTAAAESGHDLDPVASGALFDRIEHESRATLDGMRDVLGLLRGEEAGLAPAPTVARLDALLARHQPRRGRLTVTGDPRALPAAVELSAYRIVEHLLDVLADADGQAVDVAVRFDDAVLELRVSGRVGRSADLRTAIARARERADFLGGSLDTRVSRGRATAVALLPVAG